MKKILLLLFTGLLLISLSACVFYFDWDMEYSEEKIYEIFGRENAFIYDEEYDTYLYFYYYNSNISACIDNTMHIDYITASILAIYEFDSLEYISITYHLSNSCNVDTEIIIFTTYSGAEEPFCSGEVGGDDGILGCNSFWYDNTGAIKVSTIKFNTDTMDGLPFEIFEHVALHELGHTFGLDDLYHKQLEKYSIMYHTLGDVIFIDLTVFDKYNLEYMYKD